MSQKNWLLVASTACVASVLIVSPSGNFKLMAPTLLAPASLAQAGTYSARSPAGTRLANTPAGSRLAQPPGGVARPRNQASKSALGRFGSPPRIVIDCTNHEATRSADQMSRPAPSRPALCNQIQRPSHR